MNHLTQITSLAFCIIALTCPAGAQNVLFSETFENMGNVPIGGWGPQGLINKGWTFHNNSEIQGPVAWVSGCCWDGVISPFSGTGYLAAYQDSAAGGNPPQYSAWAILPAVANQQQGDIFTFYTVSSDTSPSVSVHLEVRYSPSGGVNPGTSALNVGDFTSTLLTISPMPNYNQGLYDGWTKWEVEVPGPGRIAFRQMGTESLYFGIEDASVSTPTPPTGPLPEGFEDLGGICGPALQQGPCALVNEGWIFRDQGTNSQGPAWEPPYPVNEFTPHSGFSFMKSHKAGNSGSINTWAILPDFPMQNGDVLSFVVRGHLGDDGAFQVRYSPSGGTSTGAGGEGVGDFTQTLLHITSLPYDAWQQIFVTLPGDGRIALRNYDPFEPFFNQAVIVAIDTMALNAEPVGPPIPQAGETVTWTAALNPIEIDTDLFVPAGGTILVEPGVQIFIDEQATLNIAGTLQGDGTPANPILFQSVANFPPGLLIPGTLDLSHAIIKTQVRPDLGGSLLFDHCTFTAPNGILYGDIALIIDNDDKPPFVSVENCLFDNADMIVTDATLRLTNTSFINSIAWPLDGYWYFDNVDIDGGYLALNRDQQDVYLNNIQVRNAQGAGINIGGSNIGTNYFFGPDNVLQNNFYPVRAEAGILPGSVLPSKGNTIDKVLLQPGGFEIFGPVTWANPGIPYVVHGGPYLVGDFKVLPGVTMQFGPGEGFFETSNFIARGSPEEPVQFVGDDALWHGIYTPARLEHTHVAGSQYGIINAASGLPGWFDSCVFSNNDRAQVGSAVIRGSKFFSNAIGANIGFTMDLDGQTNPNSFEGNSLAVQNASDATHNWWGHPTGPSAPQNPGGQGDSVASFVPVLPFRTTPPDDTNHPPIVNLQEVYFVSAPGSKVILHWQTTDTDVVSHRVLVSTQFDVLSQYQVVASNLPATQQGYALTVPNITGVYYVRVEAIDSIGQIGWDKKISSARSVAIESSLVLPLQPPATHHILGHPVPLDASHSFFNTGYVLLDGQMGNESFGAWGVLATVVDASTDSVRFGMLQDGGIGWLFSDYFTVRPDARLGDAAPSVTLLAPLGGTFAGGTTVPLAWTAGDDEGIRSVTIQATYDGGITYHDIGRRLPATQTTFNWQLPPLTEPISNVRVRVVVEDLRFQNASATSNAITLVPGNGNVVGDINDDGLVNVDDLITVINSWGACQGCPADLDGNGAVDVDDLLIVINNWS